MFKLIISTLLLVSLNAWAVSDAPTRKNTEAFIKALKQERTVDKKLELFSEFKDDLFNRIISFEIEKIENKNDIFSIDQKEAFRSLNEFEGYLDLITIKTFSKEDCKSTKENIETSASKESGVVPEAVESLKILSALCEE